MPAVQQTFSPSSATDDSCACCGFGTSKREFLLASCKARHLKQTSWQKGCPQHGLLRVHSAKGDVAARDDDPERETSAFTPQKLKLLRETLSPPRREKRGAPAQGPSF